MDDNSILGATLGQLGQTVKKAGQQIVKLPEEIGKNAGEQIGGVKQNPDDNKALENKSRWQSDEERIKFLRDFYGKSDAPPQEGLEADKKVNQQVSQSGKPSEFQEQVADKSPEEQKELMALRNQLHREVYYDPTFNPIKKQEERPAEKVEKEKKQEMAELEQKDAKKPPPLAVVREQNKAEMFRGASG